MNISRLPDTALRYRYYLNLGSNMGDRAVNIDKAILRISDMFGCVIKTELVGSKPWGFDSANNFVNAGVALSSDLPPQELLARLQCIEKELSEVAHRNADGSYRDREIDIDIMTVWETGKGEVKMVTPSLTLPHPHLREREFFMKPLQELYRLFTPDIPR